MTVHEFDPSNQSDDADWWKTVYTRAFPTYEHHDVLVDKPRQLLGIDHVVHLGNNHTVNVDVKTRDKWYPDVALEVWSSKEHRRPGWLRKPLHTDYVAYAFPTRSLCYVLPFPLLRAAYERNKHKWAALADQEGSGYSEVHARNVGYTTVSIAVPLDDLLKCLTDVMTVYFESDMEPF